MYGFMQLLELIGGLGLFLYGMRVMSDGIERRAGSKMRQVLGVLTTNRFAAVLTGLSVTAIIQSSSATTVLLVSIVNAGLMNLQQSIGVIMGANIGTTFTGWIVSILGFKFKITALALPAVAIGIPFFFSKHERRRELASILIGFGILFMGLYVMKESVPDIKNNPEVLAWLQHFADVNFLTVLLFIAIGTLLTIVVQSSSAAMAITLTMAFKGWITFPIAAAIVLGENIGTTITAYLASLGMNVNAKRAARAHMLFNLLGVCWMLALFFPFIRFIEHIIPGDALNPIHIPIHLSAFHSIFNIANMALMIGFVPLMAKAVTRLVKDRYPGETGHLTFVATQTSEDLESNLIGAQAELGRMANIVYDMSLWVLNALTEDPSELEKTRSKILKFEELTDEIQVNIEEFLTGCMVGSLSEGQASRIRSMNRMAHELETIGDDCKKIAIWLNKRVKKEAEFHPEALSELSDYSSHVLDFQRYNADFLNSTVKDFSLPQAREMEKNINRQRNKLRKTVRKSLMQGANVRGEMIFMDIVRHLEQIGDSCYNVSEEIISMKEVS